MRLLSSKRLLHFSFKIWFCDNLVLFAGKFRRAGLSEHFLLGCSCTITHLCRMQCKHSWLGTDFLDIVGFTGSYRNSQFTHRFLEYYIEVTITDYCLSFALLAVAWSSVREPTQVFQLLETIYHSFDEIAKRRRVFKVRLALVSIYTSS